MRIAVLTSSYEDSAAQCAGLDPDAVPELWLQQLGHTVDTFHLKKSTSVKEIIRLSKLGYDVFLNLCDGSWDEDRAGAEVVTALERLRLPFIGADSVFYDPTREAMKRVALTNGVCTPAYRFCYDLDAVEELIAATQGPDADLSFPLLCKHFNGYNSVGMTKASRCVNADELRAEAKRFIDTFGGTLIEEFIEGREFTVLVAENPDDADSPLVCEPVECQFPPGETFKHFDLKWVDYAGLEWVTVAEEHVVAGLKAMARTMFVGLRGVGYGRLDVRMDRDGKLFFLEMNPNCGIFYAPDVAGSADVILQRDTNINHLKFCELILRSAMNRHKKSAQRRLYEVRHTRRAGFGLWATRDIDEGEVIDTHEERATYLVSRTFVEKNWNEQNRQWFAAYAYPFNDEVYGMWSPEPEEWRPINHSCDPNVWLDGLNTTARRHIKRGEQLTIDYSTFAAFCQPFDCGCGAANCRKRVTGLEFQRPELLAPYGAHVAAYVAQKSAEYVAMQARTGAAKADVPADGFAEK